MGSTIRRERVIRCGGDIVKEALSRSAQLKVFPGTNKNIFIIHCHFRTKVKKGERKLYQKINFEIKVKSAKSRNFLILTKFSARETLCYYSL